MMDIFNMDRVLIHTLDLGNKNDIRQIMRIFSLDKVMVKTFYESEIKDKEIYTLNENFSLLFLYKRYSIESKDDDIFDEDLKKIKFVENKFNHIGIKYTSKNGEITLHEKDGKSYKLIIHADVDDYIVNIYKDMEEIYFKNLKNKECI